MGATQEFKTSKKFSDKQKKVFVDIDETICFYSDIRRYDLAEPDYKNISKINRLYNEGWHVTYWTARGSVSKIDYTDFTNNQLKRWGCKFHNLIVGEEKGIVDLIIDDKAKRIEEVFPDHLPNVMLGKGVKIIQPANLYGCTIGENSFIGPFVEIQERSKIGNNTRISSHSFICSGVEIGDNCFIAHGVMFTNDKFTEEKDNWVERETVVGNNVRISSNSTILPVKIGDYVVIGAGSVVTKDVPSNTVIKGNPAK